MFFLTNIMDKRLVSKTRAEHESMV